LQGDAFLWMVEKLFAQTACSMLSMTFVVLVRLLGNSITRRNYDSFTIIFQWFGPERL